MPVIRWEQTTPALRRLLFQHVETKEKRQTPSARGAEDEIKVKKEACSEFNLSLYYCRIFNIFQIVQPGLIITHSI